MEERLAIANEFVEKREYKIPTLVDTISNQFDQEYLDSSRRCRRAGPRHLHLTSQMDRFAAWPERYFIIEQDAEGTYRCSHVGMPTTEFGYDRDQLESWLHSRVDELVRA